MIHLDHDTPEARALVEEFLRHRPEPTRRPDFDDFWGETRAELARVPLQAVFAPAAHPASGFASVFDVTYRGWGGAPIRGWFIRPAFPVPGPTACVVLYPGKGRNRGQPAEHFHYLLLGLSVLAVDVRGQGGDTPDPAVYPGGGAEYTKGMPDPRACYMRAVCADALRALDVAASRADVDPARIVVGGGSQGGALAMVAAGLDSRPALVLADVPSYSELSARVEGATGGFAMIAQYLREHPGQEEAVHACLSYFDIMNTAERVRVPLLASVGLKDEVCPPRCFFAAWNRVGSPKEMSVYTEAGHEGGRFLQAERRLEFIRRRLGPP